MIFFYNQVMSQFKTKKIHNTPVKKSPEIVPAEEIVINPKRKIRKTIAIVLFIFTLVFGINYIVQGVGNIRIGTVDNGVAFTPVIATSSWVQIVEKKWVTNILIVGIGGAGHQAWSLADSIMLASLDEEKKSVTMISIPRDLYVSYDSGTSAGKINSLYPIWLGRQEWVSILANKVAEVTWKSIHHYMVIDFTAFRYIVNALDGIEIDVIKDIYDNEYPDYNYGYTIFSVKKWIQTFDGETALRYARSRHSTSDMDRSRRQQQIINAIKTKSLSAWVITSPTKISNIIEATRSNINTDLTVADIVSLGSTFGSMEKWDIHVYNLGSDCVSYTNCSVWAYLYSPSMAYFWWAWSLIPEWAKVNKLSYYDRIRKFVDFVFQFPGIHTETQPIVVVHTTKSITYAKNLLMEMRKIGVSYDATHALKTSTGTIERSHINIYWNSEYNIGINPESDIVQALRNLDMRIPVNIVTSNEYVTTDGPKIEIVLGNDYKEFFTFADPVSYLPKIENPTPETTVVSWEKKQTTTGSTKSTQKPVQTEKTTPAQSQLPTPGEWENL